MGDLFSAGCLFSEAGFTGLRGIFRISWHNWQVDGIRSRRFFSEAGFTGFGGLY